MMVKRVKYVCSFYFVTLYVQLVAEIVMEREFEVQRGKQDIKWQMGLGLSMLDTLKYTLGITL